MNPAARCLGRPHISHRQAAVHWYEGTLDDDVFAACPTQPRNEPRVSNGVVGFGDQQQQWAFGAGRAYYDPPGIVTTAGEVPLPRDMVPAIYGPQGSWNSQLLGCTVG